MINGNVLILAQTRFLENMLFQSWSVSIKLIYFHSICAILKVNEFATASKG